MKRISVLVALVLLIAGNLHAGGRFDRKLEQLKKTKPNDTVRVIVQFKDPSVISTKLAKAQAKLLKRFKHLQGFTAQLKVKDLVNLDDLSFLSISIDEPVKGHNAIDGLEPANNSSGALAAFQKYAATGAGVGVAVIDSGVAVHPDLQNVVKTVDFTGGLNLRVDPYGHG